MLSSRKLLSRNLLRCAAVLLLAGGFAQIGRAGGAAFDLAGPVLEATVTRAPRQITVQFANGERFVFHVND